ncbi:hypothetical protein N8144_05935 [Planktomarina temperata]|nr:hypothetical protein [Planktomarina temperata]
MNFHTFFLFLFIVMFTPLRVNSEIVTDSNGNKIQLNTDGSWTYYDEDVTFIHIGSKEIFFDFRIWFNEAKITRWYEVDDFTNKKKYTEITTTCLGHGELRYSLSPKLVFKSFVNDHKMNRFNSEFEGLELWLYIHHGAVYEGNSIIPVEPKLISGFGGYTPGFQIKTNDLSRFDEVSDRIIKLCNWQSFVDVGSPRAKLIEVKLSDGRNFGKNDFWDHAKITVLHKDTVLKFSENERW